jgi:superfamily II DNA or RNA helicase
MSSGAERHMMPPVVVSGDVATVTFAGFGLGPYGMFLRVKALPDKRISWDWRRGEYTVTTQARFARLLDPSAPAPQPRHLPLASHLFDYQAWIVLRALEAGRFACWLDTGLGKTAIMLEWCRQVAATSQGRALILSPPSVTGQTIAQAAAFYGRGLPVQRLAGRDEIAAWCREPGTGVGIASHHALIPGQLGDLRRLAGLALDESSVLKASGGVIKWNLIHSARGITRKLSLTATPAPNDVMEYASQASFLETIRHEGEVIWTWFQRGADGEWTVKPHARAAFYAWMASWSAYLRDPALFGWADVLATLPEPEWHEERLPLTGEQAAAMARVCAAAGAGLFPLRLGVRERSKLAQIARGFLYAAGPAGRAIQRIASAKPARVAEITRAEARAGRPVIVWTTFDEEAEILAGLLADLDPVTVDGRTPAASREALLESFMTGDAMVLITKAQVGGYGLNLQRAKSMVFSGFDDSAERMYQAVRRAYRLGQTDRVRVFIPYVPELEGLMLGNVRAKERQFMAEAAAQEREYLKAITTGKAAA